MTQKKLDFSKSIQKEIEIQLPGDRTITLVLKKVKFDESDTYNSSLAKIQIDHNSWKKQELDGIVEEERTGLNYKQFTEGMFTICLSNYRDVKSDIASLDMDSVLEIITAINELNNPPNRTEGEKKTP